VVPLLKGPTRDELEMGNNLSEDQNRVNILQNLNSIKLLSISEQFSLYPDQTVTVDEFIEIMVKALSDSQMSNREDFVASLVDLFFRCKKTTSKTLKFEQLTSYLIEHEIS
jgi:hypothetical protein